MTERDNTNLYSAEDIEKNKVICALAYILFFLPLIVCTDSPFGRFHANQGLLLLIVAVVGNIVLGVIPIIGWLLIPLLSLAIFVFAILGIINAATGKAKELPVFGKFRIIK